jgi:hypothetical protein
VHGDLVGEDATVLQERRPGAAAPVFVDAIDNGHRRPEDDALGLRQENAARRAAKAYALERRAEQRPVHEMNPDRCFGPDPEEPAE